MNKFEDWNSVQKDIILLLANAAWILVQCPFLSVRILKAHLHMQSFMRFRFDFDAILCTKAAPAYPALVFSRYNSATKCREVTVGVICRMQNAAYLFFHIQDVLGGVWGNGLKGEGLGIDKNGGMTTIARLTRDNKQRFIWGLKNVRILIVWAPCDKGSGQFIICHP